MTSLVSVRGLLPAHRYSQSEFAHAVLAHRPDPFPAGPKTVSHAAARRMFANSGVQHRHTVQPLTDSFGLTSAARASRRQREKIVEYGAAALADALTDAGLRPDEVDLLVTTSSMAIGSPPWDLDVARLAGLRSDVQRLPLLEMGCAGGVALIARMHHHLKGNPGQIAVGVASEAPTVMAGQSTKAFSRLVEWALFGDGSAAVVMAGADRCAPAARLPRVVDTMSMQLPDSSGFTGWRVGEDGIETFLGPGLPALVETFAPPAVERLLSRHGLTVDDVGVWVCHPGSALVINGFAKGLSLADDTMSLSRSVLARNGNIFSAGTLHILADAIKTASPAGDWGVVAAFGPGIVAELVLLRWHAR